VRRAPTDAANADKWAGMTMPGTLAEVLAAKGFDVTAVYSGADRLAQFMGPVTGDVFQETNNLVGQYNAIAARISREGVATLPPIAMLDASALVSLGPAIQRGTVLERALLAKTKMAEAALRVARAELEEWKQKLVDEASRLQVAKADGADMAAGERQLAAALTGWDNLRAQFQGHVDAYSRDLNTLQTIRQQLKQEVELADRARSQQQPRQVEAARPASEPPLAEAIPPTAEAPRGVPQPQLRPQEAPLSQPQFRPREAPISQPLLTPGQGMRQPRQPPQDRPRRSRRSRR
jgi:hypothetical protein